MTIIAKPGFRQRLARCGHSLRSAAQAAGLARESATRLAHGRPVRASTARKLCEVLELDFDDLFLIVEEDEHGKILP